MGVLDSSYSTLGTVGSEDRIIYWDTWYYGVLYVRIEL